MIFLNRQLALLVATTAASTPSTILHAQGKAPISEQRASKSSESPKPDAAEQFKSLSRALVAKQLTLIKKGDVKRLMPFFTARLQSRITVENVTKAAKEVDRVTAKVLVHRVELLNPSTAKIKMKNSRTIATFVKRGGKWLADTIWFR